MSCQMEMDKSVIVFPLLVAGKETDIDFSRGQRWGTKQVRKQAIGYATLAHDRTVAMPLYVRVLLDLTSNLAAGVWIQC
jgi:hypothetical protein